MTPRHGKWVLAVAIVFIISFGLSNNAFAQESQTPIPQWVKAVAGWWSEGKLTDSDFQQCVQFLVDTGVIQVHDATAITPGLTIQFGSSNSTQIVFSYSNQTDIAAALPAFDWEKISNSSSMWADGNLSDSEFFKILQDGVNAGKIGPFEGMQNETQLSQDQLTPEVASKTTTVEIPTNQQDITINKGDSVQFVTTSHDVVYSISRQDPTDSYGSNYNIVLVPIGSENQGSLQNSLRFGSDGDFIIKISGYYANDVSNYVPENTLTIHSIEPPQMQSSDELSAAKNLAMIYSKTHDSNDLNHLSDKLYRLGFLNNP